MGFQYDLAANDCKWLGLGRVASIWIIRKPPLRVARFRDRPQSAVLPEGHQTDSNTYNHPGNLNWYDLYQLLCCLPFQEGVGTLSLLRFNQRDTT